jgi:hypothetical protein
MGRGQRRKSGRTGGCEVRMTRKTGVDKAVYTVAIINSKSTAA